MLYVRMIEDSRGDLIDIEYFCDSLCAHDATRKDPGMATPGAWPGGMETDSDKYCASCGELIERGIER